MKTSFNYRVSTIRQNLEKKKEDFSELEQFLEITTSSEEVVTGSLFVPLIGNRDGHEFIPEALRKGAIAYICQKDHRVLEKLNPIDRRKAIQVDDTLLALGEIGKFHRSRFSPFMIGITGSSGKTTTKEFMSLGVSHLGENNIHCTEKNYNNEIGVPFTILGIKENHSVVVLELGMNHAKEISRLTRIAKLHVGMITNIGPCHIENLGSLKNIAKAKAEIMEGMYKGGTLFIPEDVSCREVFESKAKQYNINLRYFSLEKSKYLKILSETSEGFQIEIAGVKADWKHPGKKLLENMSGVLEVLAFSNISIEESAKKIIEYKAALSRNVMISGKFHIIDDCYNANPDSIKSSIDSLKQVSGQNRTIAILGDMKELGKFSKKFHLEIGEYCKNNNINALIGFGNDAKFYLTTYKKGNANYERAITFTCENYSESINKIIHILKTNLKENDFVLVKGSRSMKMERIVDELKKLQE